MTRVRYHIDRTPSCFEPIDGMLEEERLFCLSDTNSYNLCFPLLDEHLKADPFALQIPPGEDQKTLGTCQRLWQRLMEEGAERNSVLLALGGGMITDLGGFVAAAYRRGMPCVLVPTTLLGMVDAAIGGKNGVDLNGYKNMIGTVRQPDEVLVHPPFLKTLDERQKRAGYAEMLKHALLEGPELFARTRALDLSDEASLEAILPDIIEVKRGIVEADPEEQGHRERLNFGHTVGHALETLFMESDAPLLHGEAVAAGMLIEALLSERVVGFPSSDLKDLIEGIRERFSLPELPNDEELLQAMEKDKKRRSGMTRFVLLRGIGKAEPGWKPDDRDIQRAFQRYRELE